MRLALSALSLALLCGGCARPQPSSRLETMPRHDEWVQVRSGGRAIQTYVVYPEVARESMVVVLIHENRGLTDWVRTVADRLAENGYIAVAPDLLSGMAPGGGRTTDFPTQDAAREAIGRLTREGVLGDVRAVVDYARSIPAADGRVSIAGFCWGGGRAWDAAVGGLDISGAYVFYGTGPDTQSVARVTAPVFGFYGGNDARVNATIPASQALMRAAGKRFEPVTYEGAGHAFMRAGETPEATSAEKKAHDEAWTRWLRLLAETPMPRGGR